MSPKMEAVDKRALGSNTTFLQNNLVLTEELYGELIEKQVLTSEMMEKIKSKQTTSGQILALTQLLPKRGSNAFTYFLNALRATDQDHIAERLEIYARSHRRGSCHDVTTEKMRTFIHKTFIQNRKFAVDDEKFLLENLVMKEDWEMEKKIKEEALDNQARLEIDVKDKDKELSDVNRRLQLSLSQHRKNVDKIEKLEEDKKDLKMQIDELEDLLRELNERENHIEKDTTDGQATKEPLSPQMSTSSSVINDEIIQMQAEELELARKKLEIVEQKARMSNAKVSSLTNKVKEFLKATCNMEDDSLISKTPMQKLEANIIIMMNRLRGQETEEKEVAVVKEEESKMELRLKDKLNETRKQKSVMKTELHRVNKRLHEILSELELERERVKKLQIEVQSKSSNESVTSRVKTPVNVHFPAINVRQERQRAMHMWKSVPSGMTPFKTDEEASYSRKRQRINSLSQEVQKKCSRCHVVYTANDSKARKTCRYHSSIYLRSLHAHVPSKWPCCGQLDQNALGCRYGNHV